MADYASRLREQFASFLARAIGSERGRLSRQMDDSVRPVVRAAMKRKRARLLAMASPIPETNDTLRLLEPPDSCQRTLQDRLFDGTYDKPFIVDSGVWRFLHFNFDSVQSAMYLSAPAWLSLAYTRKMMAFLLFNRLPERILLLGLGGGSLVKFCHRHLPGAALTAVEVNHNVIALREEFRIPPDDNRFRVICADGAGYVARLRLLKDVILADACDARGVAPELDAIEFYQDAYRGLRPGGIFVTNMCGDMSNCAAHITKIHNVFGDDLMMLQVPPDGNLIVFAFKDGHPNFDWDQLGTIAVDLKGSFFLDFPRYVRAMAIDWKLRKWQRLSV
jgi:spermidine synthase